MPFIIKIVLSFENMENYLPLFHLYPHCRLHIYLWTLTLVCTLFNLYSFLYFHHNQGRCFLCFCCLISFFVLLGLGDELHFQKFFETSISFLFSKIVQTLSCLVMNKVVRFLVPRIFLEDFLRSSSWKSNPIIDNKVNITFEKLKEVFLISTFQTHPSTKTW